MSERFDQLNARHRALKAQSQAQREAVAAATQELHQTAARIDRSVSVARNLIRNPAVIVAGVAVLAAIGPGRILRLAARSGLLANTVNQVLRLTRR